MKSEVWPILPVVSLCAGVCILGWAVVVVVWLLRLCRITESVVRAVEGQKENIRAMLGEARFLVQRVQEITSGWERRWPTIEAGIHRAHDATQRVDTVAKRVGSGLETIFARANRGIHVLYAGAAGFLRRIFRPQVMNDRPSRASL